MVKKPESTNNEMSSALRKAAPYLNIGYAFFGAIALFGYLGHLLDQKTGQSPLFILIGVFSGFFLGLYRTIKVVNDLERK
jgi:F0F1-type ATP synthase assembly protein I